MIEAISQLLVSPHHLVILNAQMLSNIHVVMVSVGNAVGILQTTPNLSEKRFGC
jgi:hypothetical protein